MSDSSKSDPRTVLSRISAAQVAALLDITRNSKLRDRKFIESVYRKQAQYFDETVLFLEAVGWIKIERGQLEVTSEANAFHSHPKHSFLGEGSIVEAMTQTDGPYQKLLTSYLAVFHVKGTQVIFTPSTESRLHHSAIRNLLMQFGMVSHRSRDDSYLLDEDSAHLYFWAKNCRGASSKKQLEKSAKRREALGDAAEEAVLKYEKKRVGEELASFVTRVSVKNPGACFDIRSITTSGKTHTPRFIEVKAVPAETHQFFWTASELEAASVLREKYFLYLLPSLGKNQFDLTRLEIIADPYANVYQSPENWEKDENIIVCRRRLSP